MKTTNMHEIDSKLRYWNVGGWIAYWLMIPLMIWSWFNPWIAIPTIAAVAMNAGCMVAWGRWSDHRRKLTDKLEREERIRALISRLSRTTTPTAALSAARGEGHEDS